MSIKSFKGGVHVPERKYVLPEAEILVPMADIHRVWIPVSQGGAPNTPIVEVGTVVKKGEKIAESKEMFSVPVHASVSGTVTEISSHLVSGNTNAPCICIEVSSSDEVESFPLLDPFTCTREESLARIREAGIVGMGGAAFPTHIKLNIPEGTKITHVIANGAECEPYLCVDAAVMYQNAEAIVDGLAIAMHIVGSEKGIIALEDNKKDLLPILQKAIEKYKEKAHSGIPCDISTRLCKAKYPQGGEKTLIQVVLGKELPSRSLPFQSGVVVQNIGTLKAISEAFRNGLPLIERALTISGGACKKPLNIQVPLGTCIEELVLNTLNIDSNAVKIVSGGPMMGFAMKSSDFPVQKNTSGVLFMTEAEICTDDESPCIGCSRCMQACPYSLAPVLMDKAIKAGDYDTAVRCGLRDCVLCGACSFVCPARIRLSDRFRNSLALLARKDAKKKQTQGAR